MCFTGRISKCSCCCRYFSFALDLDCCPSHVPQTPFWINGLEEEMSSRRIRLLPMTDTQVKDCFKQFFGFKRAMKYLVCFRNLVVQGSFSKHAKQILWNKQRLLSFKNVCVGLLSCETFAENSVFPSEPGFWTSCFNKQRSDNSVHLSVSETQPVASWQERRIRYCPLHIKEKSSLLVTFKKW